MNTPINSEKPRLKLGILQAGRAPEAMLDSYPDYNRLFVDLLGEDEFDYCDWPVLDDVFPDSIDDADVWLITGSRHGAYEPHSWIPPLEALIRQIHESGKPMVGICFGHQIIAQALGGTVEKFSGGWSVGRVEYSLDETVFPATRQDGSTVLPTSIRGESQDQASSTRQVPLMAFHQDQVTVPPACARTVGRSDFCQHAALLYDNRILTIQPHPEFDKHFVGGLLATRGDILPPSVKESAEQTLDEPIGRDAVARTLRQFLQQERQ